MTLRCLWVASNVNAERVLSGLENNTKSALAVKQVIVASCKSCLLLKISVSPGFRQSKEAVCLRIQWLQCASPGTCQRYIVFVPETISAFESELL